MALAPLSQTVIVTEDGSLIAPSAPVLIPPHNVTPPGPPVITTPAGISSDGTPQVGETFTLVRPTGNGPVVTERLLENGADVWSEVTDLRFTARAAGSLRYEADLQGPDGTTATSGSTITVLAPLTVTGTPPTTGTVGQPYNFTPVISGGSGTRIVSTNIPLLPGQTFAPATGATGGTPTQAGTLTGLVYTVTDDTGSASTTATTVTIAAAPSPSNQMTANGETVTAGGEPMTAGVY